MLHSSIVACSHGTIDRTGLVTTRPIRKGVLVWTLDEPTFSWKQIEMWPEERRRAFARYGFQCGVERYSFPEGLSREMNHSCDPNPWWADSDSIVARRDIRAGDEVTYDYSTCDIDLVFTLACRCGTPRCRKKISNRDYLDPRWQEQYGSNLPPHVLAAIEVARQHGEPGTDRCPVLTCPS